MIPPPALALPPAIVAPAPVELALAQATPPSPGAAPDPSVPANAQPPAATVPAAQPRSQNPQDVHLLGDWFGVRTAMTDAGITPTFAHVSHTLTNVRGGTKNIFMQAGQFTLGLQFDLEKITGSVPGTFQATVVRRYGESFNQKTGLNTLVNPMSIQGRGETYRVSQLWYRTRLGKLDVKLGRMFLNEDFNQARCDFVSGYFCLGENTRSNSTVWPTSPVSQWAVRLQYPIAKDLVAKTAVYQYNPRNLDTERNLYIGWKGATGVMVPFELSYTPKGRLPGTYTIGFFYSNADMNDVLLNTDRQIRAVYGGSPLVRHDEWGGYLNVRQQIVAPNKDGSNGLAFFLNMSVLSEQSTPNDSAIGMGLNYTGAIPGRPRDEIGFAVGRGRVNDRLTDAARYVNRNGLGTMPVRTKEYAVEAYYAVNVVPGLVLQPDVQFIFNPRGDAAQRNAILVGVRTAVTF